MIISTPIAKKILDVIAARGGVDVLDLRSANRNEPLALRRAEAMWILRSIDPQAPLSFADIGSFFNRDHAQARSCCKRIEEKIAAEPAYAAGLQVTLVAVREIAGKVVEGQIIRAEAAAEPGTQREPPLLALLKTGRDELQKAAEAMHRLSLLFDKAIIRIEGREEQPITVNVQASDEKVV